VIRRLVDDWRVDENYSHGFLIPLIGIYAIWSMRDRLMQTACEPRFLLGGLLMLLAVMMLVFGLLGAELYLTRISMIVSIVALVIYFAGLKWLKNLAFPIGLLLFAIPLPNIIFNQITAPLQLLASDYATTAIRLFGVPALREGNVIELAQIKLQVVEACSGIRSLMTLATLAVVYLRFFEKRMWHRIAVLASVVPIAVVANAARVAGTGVMSHYWGAQAAEGFMHMFSGWVVFFAAFLLFMLIAQILIAFEKLFRRR